MTDLASWELDHGDLIAPGLIAMKLIGGGTAYEAYLAFDESMYSPVVVKVVRPDQVDDGDTLKGLDREVEMLRRLNHPVVVRRFASDERGERPHIVLENLDGPSLSSLLRRHGPLQLPQLLPLGIEMCSALHYLRGAAVCHLDIKPSNIIMGAPARLIDLSVARDVADSQTLTYPIGSDEYMAPEQCDPLAFGGVGFAADMWGLGATLFKAVSGYRAFDNADPDQRDPARRWPQLVAAPYTLPDQVPAELADLILSCLHQDPADRPAPGEFADALEPMMAALPKARLSGFKISL